MKIPPSLTLLATLLGISPLSAQQISVPDLQAKAAKGDPTAEYQLGRAYQLGNEGVAQDFPKAIDFYNKAATQGNAKAMYNLGIIYHRAQGVTQDNVTAQKWFQKAADAGLPAAELEVGLAYMHGDNGIDQDCHIAAKWLLMAAQPSNPPEVSGPASNALAFLFENGQGVAKDVKQAVFWYTQAADANFAMAQGNLGRLYNTGSAVKKDPAQAYMWLKLATFQKDPMGQHIMSEALSGDAFTAQEKAEGDRLADEFRAKHNLPPLRGPIPVVVTPGMVEVAKAKADGFKKMTPAAGTTPANSPAPTTTSSPAVNASAVAPGSSPTGQ